MEVLAVMPARGGSKGVVRKNVRSLAGKPLITHAIEFCRSAEVVCRVIVSTDDAEIAAVAEQHGAEVMWRPAEISGDEARSEDAVLHVLGELRECEQYVPDIVLLVQCTSPLTLPADIDGTVQALFSENADCALAVTPFHGFLWRADRDTGAVGINHDGSVRLRRQETEPQFLETGAVYAMRIEGFLEARHRFFGRIALYVMPAERCLEIDEVHDLVVAEVLVREQQRQMRAHELPRPLEGLVLDFDGVLTDNRVIVNDAGGESVICSRSDGWALGRLTELGFPILVLSTEENPVVQVRCGKLGIPCIQGSDNKLADLKRWAEEEAVDLSKIAYVGNDVNDLPCLQSVGCGIVVSDAHPDVHTAAKIVLEKNGGQGAVRELVDMIVKRLKEG